VNGSLLNNLFLKSKRGGAAPRKYFEDCMTIKKSHIAIFGVLVLVAIGVYYYQLWHMFGKMDERGQFGDTFGAVTSLFTALGFIGIAITIYQQSKQIQQKDEEVKASNKALARQLELMAVTAKLTALPNLIDTTAEYLERTFKDLLKELYPAGISSLSVAQIDAFTKIIENIHALKVRLELGGENIGPEAFERSYINTILIGYGSDCLGGLINGLKTLRGYKADLIRLYAEM
jgi:uncharacterized membrane protein